MKPNQHLQTLLLQRFMNRPEDDGCVPHAAALEEASELASEIENRLRERIGNAIALPFGESAGVVSALARAVLVSELTPARALELASSRKAAALMRARKKRDEAESRAWREREQAEAEGRLVPFRPQTT